LTKYVQTRERTIVCTVETWYRFDMVRMMYYRYLEEDAKRRKERLRGTRTIMNRDVEPFLDWLLDLAERELRRIAESRIREPSVVSEK